MPRGVYKRTPVMCENIRLSKLGNKCSVGREVTQETREKLSVTSTTHGMRHTCTYNSWEAMKKRCLNVKAVNYFNYGGRGITVCEQWLTFEGFFADMGERPEGKTLDRYPDKDGNYEPGNCRWATPGEQANNRRKRSVNA